jgi:hypothetical protein
MKKVALLEAALVKEKRLCCLINPEVKFANSEICVNCQVELDHLYALTVVRRNLCGQVIGTK